MISRLITILQESDLLLSNQEIESFSEAQPLLNDEDIADALWLASKIGGAYEVSEPAAIDESSESDDAITIEVIDDSTVLTVSPPTVSVYMPPAAKPDTGSVETPEAGLPIQVQAAPALAHPREISRSLRPLMRKVPSLTRSELDESATVNRIAERDIWLPILKPSPERWFDLELVIEASQFSFIWQETLDEFQQLLRGQGAFRNVRTWFVKEAATGQPQLVAKQPQDSDTDQDLPLRSHKELVDVSGRRLVLFISDCRSRLWRQGQIHNWLTLWSQHGPAAIVQLLPERLWSESELDVGFAVQVGSLLPGAPNPKLQVRELPARTEIAPADTLLVPIVTLTAKALKQWALVVAAAGRQRSPARLFDLSWVKDPERDQSVAVIQPQSAKERVELFMATASPVAQRLARMMAAVPVELPVVHLIQQELLPEVQSVHIAEVYTSSLLKDVKPNLAKPDAPARYDFVKEVRGLLNEITPLDETLGVLEALSRRIARTLGFEIKSFTALLSPKSDWSQETKDAILPFAQIATEVLHRLGGDYAELAQLVEHDAQRYPNWIQPLESDTPFPDLEVLEFITAQLDYDPYIQSQPQTQEVEVVGIVLDQEAENVLPQKELQDLRSFTVQIRHIETQTILGTGFVVSEAGRIVTCKHVVMNAGVNPQVEDELAEVIVYFPQASNPQARIQRAIAFQYLNDFDDDIAVLKINAEVLPEGVGVATLDTAQDPTGYLEARRFRSFGYRRGESNFSGMWVEGRILGFVESPHNQQLQNDLLQLESDQIAPGISGAAVLELERNRVIGVITATSGTVRGRVFATDLAILSKSPFNLQIPKVQVRLRLLRKRQTVGFFVESLNQDLGLEMMQIPVGTFLMGSPEDELERSNSEGPQHEVNIATFFMGKYPVTQAQWRAVAALPQVNRELEPDPSSFKGDQRPVEQVSWHDAVEFCDRLSVYTGRAYRLSTEAEWEYACRAGTATPFHFGETITTDLANYRGTDDEELSWSGSYGRGPKGEFRKETTPVDHFGIANAFGLCDMHGNVWEWCQDQWHESYEGATTDGSAWLSEDENASRVIRGGSWHGQPSNCRSAYRVDAPPALRDDLVGFRVVCAAPRTL
ncbi:MAG: SUMF1/EgtB/PvdO family nonheme iron enzyme [Stenomitos rutilans HA7619-LM2]|jgi:formylglycine-generating enzyme required for sulfatase activity|nr:SUMF1/EgtB/PvdO family nonheme iron enzyme [Stenomitos rutilans HA7619-LM2]